MRASMRSFSCRYWVLRSMNSMHPPVLVPSRCLRDRSSGSSALRLHRVADLASERTRCRPLAAPHRGKPTLPLHRVFARRPARVACRTEQWSHTRKALLDVLPATQVYEVVVVGLEQILDLGIRAGDRFFDGL